MSDLILAESGEIRATIVLGKRASPASLLAARELQYCIEQITGATLPIQNAEGDLEGVRILSGVDVDISYHDALTAQELSLARYEHAVLFREDGVALIGHDAAETTGETVDYTEATGRDGEANEVALPGMFDDQGTLRAAYDFLEHFCGVRFYGPKAVSIVFPRTPNLTVTGEDVRRGPAIKHASGSFTWRNPIMGGQYGDPSDAALRLFERRMRLGGIPWYTNHTLHNYRTRFPRSTRPEFYADSGEGRLCYSSKALAKQVALDARAYFDGEGMPDIPGAEGMPKTSDYYPVVPEDAARYCGCAECSEILDAHAEDLSRSEDGTPLFNDGRASHLWFRFVNRIARELQKTHPDKYLSTLAYENYYWYPTEFALEPNVAIAPCLGVRNHWHRAYGANEMRHYSQWAQDDRPIFLWNYYCHPEEQSMIQKWHCWPGFMIHHEGALIKQFARDGVLGVFLCGIGEQVDFYATMKLYDDPTQDIDELLTEFFTLYFGKAARPMQAFYASVEATYSNPDSWPQDGGFHENESLAWDVLGTEPRMAKLGKLMTEAEELATLPLERERVALWKAGVWNYMREGREQYQARVAGADPAP